MDACIVQFPTYVAGLSIDECMHMGVRDLQLNAPLSWCFDECMHMGGVHMGGVHMGGVHMGGVHMHASCEAPSRK